MGTLLQDLRYALRSLTKNPGWNVLVVATLGLGVGAVVAIFSVARGVLIERLPYRDPERLVRIGHLRPRSTVPGSSFSPQDFDDVAAARTGLERLAAWTYEPNQSGMALTGSGEPERLPAAKVSGSFFETLGMPAALGRTLLPEDDRPGRNQVAVISEGLWKRRFSGDPTIVGKPIVLDGRAFTIVGVMPRDFEFPAAEVDVWSPLSLVGEDAVPHRREVRWLDVLGRLGSATSIDGTRAGIDAVLSRLAGQYPDSNAGFERALVVPLSTVVTRDVRKPVWMLLGAVFLVLLIGCVNVANLLLARATARQRELGIRAALGASRGRLVRQLLTESLALSLAGSFLGLVFANWGIEALAAVSQGHVPRAGSIRMDTSIVAFALLLSTATGVAFGLLPALRGSRSALRGALAGGSSRGATQDKAGSALRGGLVVGEVALAVALLVGAGLLLRSFWRLTHADPGLRPDPVLTLSITIPDAVYAQEKDAAYRSAILSSLRALPAVAAAGASKTLPLHGGGEHYRFTVEGRPELRDYDPDGGAIIVTPGYFEALGIPILRGRAFTEDDIEAGRPVLLVNRALARQLWGDADPIGKRLVFGGKMRIEVIGESGDVRQDGLETSPRPAVYVPMSLFPRGTLKIYLRTPGDPSALAGPARQAVHRFNPDQPISGVAPLSAVVADTVARPRFLTQLVGVFGAAALLLAALGVYGVLSFSVARRTREIGVRMALGADRSAVRRLVIVEGMRLAIFGLGLGIPAAVVAARAVRSLLFEVPPADPATLGAAALVLCAASLAACAIPAARAARLDPQAALRSES